MCIMLALWKRLSHRPGLPGVAVVISVAALLGAGAYITVDSTNRVSGQSTIYRWEVSSVDTGNWVTSWHDIAVYQSPPSLEGVINQAATKAYTSAWNGGWQAGVEHRTSPDNKPLMDTFLNYDSTDNRFVLVALDFDVGWHIVWFRRFTDSLGRVWGSMKKLTGMSGDPSTNITWDFPSIAINSAGRIVVGASKIVNQENRGYWTMYSTDNGNTWFGPYVVDPNEGGLSRVVASSSGFHAFVLDRSNPFTLWRWSSPEGQNWTRQQTPIAQYQEPRYDSQNEYCGSGNCGPISYASTPDAVGSSGLGWVVAFPVNVSGRNAINVATENGGGVTITHASDLFFHGITTSSSGDWWLSYLTYTSGTSLPLLQGVVYRKPGATPSYLGAVINGGNLDPTGWLFHKNPGLRCGQPCFVSGDYLRPASNSYAGASIPLVEPSARLNDVVQRFVRDPDTANVPQFLPKMEPFKIGTDLSPRGVLTPTHIEQIARRANFPDVSTMVWESMRNRSGR